MAEPQDTTVRGESPPGSEGREGRWEEVERSGGASAGSSFEERVFNLHTWYGKREGNSAFAEVINVNNRLLGAGKGEE